MKYTTIILFVVISITNIKISAQDAPHANALSVEMTRRISKELLGPNSGPYLQPLVTTSNATANSRFFRSAFVPKKVDKLYFRFGIHSMFGFVRDDQKSYAPIAPRMTINEVLADKNAAEYIINPFDPTKSTVIIKDTAGMVVNILKYLFDKGLDPLRDSATSGLSFPNKAATVYGNSNATFSLNGDYFKNQIMKDDPLLSVVFKQLSPSVQDTILKAINQLPKTLALPTGGNINSIFAAIPQFEIGSFMGTELLIRLIPPIKLDKNIGTFSFWGVGLKHSLSQYFNDAPFDAAIQCVYQQTHIDNTIGVTNAELNSDGKIYNINLQASKHFKDIIDVYTGISYENTSITSSYKFYIPAEQQISLGLLRWVPPTETPKPEPPEWPGDTKPQTVNYNLSDTNLKFILGVAKPIGPVTIFIDYNISKFNIFTAGVDIIF
ncbi:MAG: hypothetical protein JST20_03280 [Bacteroidetes bacterium]|nr:hypothetical protein [Bacteroidota bacterium]